MHSSQPVRRQNFSDISVGDRNYVATDGAVKYCRIAPLLELPIDFMAWFEPSGGHAAHNFSKAEH